MANVITEGFDWFPSSQGSTQRQFLLGANNFFEDNHLNGGGMVIPDVRTGRFSFGKALSWLGNFGVQKGTEGYVVPTGVDVAEGFVGFAFYLGNGTTSSVKPGVGFFDATTGDMQFFVAFEAFGCVKLYQGYPTDGSQNPKTPVASSLPGSFQEDEWFHVEIHGLIANSGGSVEVRVNTVPVLQVTGADTQNTARASFDSIYIGMAHGTLFPDLDWALDDLFVNDTSGTSNNTWAGNLRVKTQFMTADGATDNFTIGGSSPAATQWQSVLNQGLDDTKYVFSPNVGDIDLFTPDPNLNAPYVRCVQVRMALRQDDATQRVARALLRIGGVNYLGTVDQFTNQTYTFYRARWQLSPATSVTFTGAEVNGLQAGIKVQA